MLNSHFEIYPIELLLQKNVYQEPWIQSTVFHELLWVRKGTGTIQTLSGKYTIEEQSMYCFGIGQLTAIEPAGKIDGYYIRLSASYLYIAGNQLCISLLSTQYKASKIPIRIQLDKEVLNEMDAILGKMRKEFVNYYALRMEMLKGLLQLFLLYLARKIPATECPEVQTHDVYLTKRFIIYLSDHFVTKKLVSDYALALNVTPGYLNLVVKKVTGFTASYHIQQFIVSEAKKQAIYSNRSMKEIGYNLGFADMAHFSKFFKTNSGMNFTRFKREMI